MELLFLIILLFLQCPPSLLTVTPFISLFQPKPWNPLEFLFLSPPSDPDYQQILKALPWKDFSDLATSLHQHCYHLIRAPCTSTLGYCACLLIALPPTSTLVQSFSSLLWKCFEDWPQIRLSWDQTIRYLHIPLGVNSTVCGPRLLSLWPLIPPPSPLHLSFACFSKMHSRFSVLPISSVQKLCFPILTWSALHSSVTPSKALSWPACLKHYMLHPPLSLHISLYRYLTDSLFLCGLSVLPSEWKVHESRSVCYLLRL